MRAMRALLALVCLVGMVGIARAHDAFPLLLTVRQAGEQLYTAELTLPPSLSGRFAPELHMPPTCKRLAGQSAGAGPTLFRCVQGLGGREVRFSYAGSAPSVPTLVRMSWQSGETRSLVLAPGQSDATLPQPESAAGVAKQYLGLGVEHILSGYDHLLFLVCLLWLAGTPRRILVTITGFTLAHSVTLALSALGVVYVPVPPVEASIALSIVFVAREIFKGRRDTLSWRYPIAVSSSFGLLHGLGFAAVLEQIGLPQTEIFTGLLFFNLGVEVGQLLFVGTLFGFYLALRHLRSQWVHDIGNHDRFRRASSIVVGVLASYWLVERTAGFFS